jgi:hypothetical protein
MLSLRSGRGAVLVAVTATAVALIATGTATGAVGRMLGDAPAEVRIPANQPAGVVRAPKVVVPDPPWAKQLPPNVVYPILTDPSSCSYQGTSIPCKNGTGYLNPLDNCYWAAENPQPKAGAAVWLGLSVSDGNIYDTRCVVGLDATLKPVLATVKVQFASKVPPGTPPGLGNDAGGVILAAGAAVVVVGILAPSMGLQPQSAASRQAAIDADRNNSTAGLVGLPTWYWSTANLLTAGPLTLNLTLPALLTLQASLLGQRLEWDTGDNGNVVVCEKLGKAFTTGQAGTTPPCGYTYTKPGTYAVTARSVWFIAASVPLLATGTVLIVRSSLPRYIKIDELQVVTE